MMMMASVLVCYSSKNCNLGAKCFCPSLEVFRGGEGRNGGRGMIDGEPRKQITIKPPSLPLVWSRYTLLVIKETVTSGQAA